MGEEQMDREMETERQDEDSKKQRDIQGTLTRFAKANDIAKP